MRTFAQVYPGAALISTVVWHPPVLPKQPVETLVQENQHLGIEPDAWTAGARWRRERDIPDHVYFRALEAL